MISQLHFPKGISNVREMVIYACKYVSNFKYKSAKMFLLKLWSEFQNLITKWIGVWPTHSPNNKGRVGYSRGK